LADLPADVPIRWSDGMTVGRLRHAVLQELEAEEKMLNGKSRHSD